MRKPSLNQHGSFHLGIAAVVLALALVGFIGYRVATKHKDDATATKTTATQQQPATTTSSSNYTSSGDVAKDDASLNTADIDQSLDTSQLDSDINNLL